MKKTTRISIVIFALCSLLSIFAVPAMAWDWPCPDECYYWTGYNCILIGDCGVADPCPGECCDCIDCECIPDDSDCGDPDCWNCVSCECECDITVNSVSSDEDEACVGCNITFTASVTGRCSCVDWSGGGDPATASGTCSFTTQWDTTGTKTVTATPDCGSSKQKQVTIIEVDVTLSVEDNLTDCMEGRYVTYTATASENFPHGLLNPILFTFHYEEADGTPWTDTDWSTDLVEDNTAVADDVLDGDSDHKFTTPIYVEADNDGCHAQSSTLYVDVYELWIDYFKDSASGKDWKVVVNKNIAYSGIAASGAKSWAWDTPDGVPDMWNPTGGNSKTGSGMVIPNSDLPDDDDWDYFGDTYGTVKVFCEDAEGGNNTFYSTSMNPAKKVQVFFELHATTNPGGTNPNWYYYWSEALGVTGDHTYNGALPTSQTTVTSATTWTIEIGQNAHWSTMGNPPTGQMYINGFWATNLHENWHKDHRVHNFSAHGSWGGLPPAVDPDGDDICTPWENTIGTNPNVPNSTEDGANWAEQNGVYNHQDKDWACPGSQW